MVGNAGPGADIRVRVHFPGGSSKIGQVKWNDDRVNGPAIVIPDTENPFNEGVIQLGGSILYEMPPRISSTDSARNRLLPADHVMEALKMPIHPDAQRLTFEIIKE